jgi:outer membrane protein OmpA-like peptidoglycan-associated protein
MNRAVLVLASFCLAACGAGARDSGPEEPAAAAASLEAAQPGEDDPGEDPPPASEVPTDPDGDAITDPDDACPEEPEDMDGFEDADGCPEPDNDGDAIPDDDDQCPNEPETYNGTDDADGCPDTSKVVVISCPHPKHVQEIIVFTKGTAKIAKQSFAILDAVVQVVEANPQILRVQVAAYAHGKGKKQKKSIALARKRAEAIVSYLEGKGVPPGVFSAAAYGSVCPVVSFKKNAAEFFLLETDAGCAEVDFACDEAIDLGLVPPEDEKYLEGSGHCE